MIPGFAKEAVYPLHAVILNVLVVVLIVTATLFGPAVHTGSTPLTELTATIVRAVPSLNAKSAVCQFAIALRVKSVSA